MSCVTAPANAQVPGTLPEFWQYQETLAFQEKPITLKPPAVRMCFAETWGSNVEIGFTDGTVYRFPSTWLRAVAGSSSKNDMHYSKDEALHPAFHSKNQMAAAYVDQSSLHLVIQWADPSGTIPDRSTFDANMLRAHADKVAEALDKPTLKEPFRGPAVWTGKDLEKSPWWSMKLTDDEIEDLVQVTKAVVKENKVTWLAEGVPDVIAKQDFPLNAPMVKKLQGIADELEYGKGLAMIRNMPVTDKRLSEVELAVMYLGISVHIGNVVLQSSSGLRSVSRGYGLPLGRVQAEMTGETPAGGKQTNNHFRLHTDRCDVISLMSIRTAPQGGASRLCSAPAVYNAMLARHPELAEALTEPIDRIWEGANGFFRLPVIDITPSGQCTTQISPSYVENAQFLSESTGRKKATPTQIAALDKLEEIGMELGVEFMMQPGMLYFLNNHQIYHGRGSWNVTEGEQSGSWGKEGRLLFRTWISPYNSRMLPDNEQYRTIWGSVEGGKPRGGYEQAVNTGNSPKPQIPKDHVYYSLFSDETQKHSMNGHSGTILNY